MSEPPAKKIWAFPGKAANIGVRIYEVVAHPDGEPYIHIDVYRRAVEALKSVQRIAEDMEQESGEEWYADPVFDDVDIVLAESKDILTDFSKAKGQT